MKIQRKLNILLIILIVILVSAISFGGVYFNDKNKMKSIVPDYVLDAELEGYRQVTLNLADEEDDDGTESETMVVTTASEDQEGSVEVVNDTPDEEAKDDEEDLRTPENFKKSAEIIKSRLKSLEVKNYTVSLDENAGKIVLTLPEDEQVDIILADIVEIGEFTIKDSKTNEVLLSNSDVDKVKFSLGQASAYSTAQTITMSINFNLKGSKKFKQITQDYQNVANENTTAETNASEDEDAENEEEETAENETTDETSEESEEESKKQVTINIDESTLLTTDFDSIIDNGSLALSFSASSDEELDEQLFSAYNLGALIENDVLPIKYQVEGNTYVASSIKDNTLKAIIYIEIGLALVMCLYMIIRYRLEGILRTITSVGFVAILLLILRITNVTFSLEGIFALELGFIMNIICNLMFLKAIKENKFDEKKKEKTFKDIATRYTLILVPAFLTSLPFGLSAWASISSFGMILFWSAIISWVYNIAINKLLTK